MQDKFVLSLMEEKNSAAESPKLSSLSLSSIEKEDNTSTDRILQNVPLAETILGRRPTCSEYDKEFQTRFKVQKVNRYRMLDNRFIQIDRSQSLFRVLDTKLYVHQVWPYSLINTIKPSADAKVNGVIISFLSPNFKNVEFNFLSLEERSVFINSSSHILQQIRKSKEKCEPIIADSNEYPIHTFSTFKRNTLIISIDTTERRFRMLSDKRKCINEYLIANISQLEISKSKPYPDSKIEQFLYPLVVYIGLHSSIEYNFISPTDQLAFIENICYINSSVVVKDDSESNIGNETIMRFSVSNLSQVGVVKKRILFIDTKRNILKIAESGSEVLEIDLRKVFRVEKSLENNREIILKTKGENTTLLFATVAAREMFVSKCRSLCEMLSLEEAMCETVEDRPFTIFIGSWNTGECEDQPSEIKFSEWIPPCRHDIYVIGFQEMPSKNREEWINSLISHISGCSNDSSYIIFSSSHLWGIELLILARKSIYSRLSNVQENSVSTGIGDIMGNKGAIGVAFAFDETKFCFIVSHLAARSERLDQRRADYIKIVRNIKLGCTFLDLFHHFDHIFWFGDLNYRIEMDLQAALDCLAREDWNYLQNHDQLLNEQKKMLSFAGFQEGELKFKPTYRWEKGMIDVYSNKRNQIPSWTDRILYKSLAGNTEISQNAYSSVPNLLGSDHRPIFALFEFIPRPVYSVPDHPEDSSPKHLCEISFTSISFSLPVLPSNTPKEELDAYSLLLQQQLFLIVYADCIENSVWSNERKYDPVHEAWVFPDSSIPVFYPFINDIDYLANQHLTISVVALAWHPDLDIGGGDLRHVKPKSQQLRRQPSRDMSPNINKLRRNSELRNKNEIDPMRHQILGFATIPLKSVLGRSHAISPLHSSFKSTVSKYELSVGALSGSISVTIDTPRLFRTVSSDTPSNHEVKSLSKTSMSSSNLLEKNTTLSAIRHDKILTIESSSSEDEAENVIRDWKAN